MMIRYAVLKADKTIDKYGDCQPCDLQLQAATGQTAIKINIDGWLSDETHVYDEATDTIVPRNT
jgi:hypothetical protein